MGYFNYFIKCIIRNIAYKLCKPKVFFTVLLAVMILFGLKHFGYCALDDLDYEMISDGFATITANQGTIISQLSSIGVDVSELETQLNSIKNELVNISAYTNLTNAHLMDIVSKINTLNTNITNIYNKLEENQQELIQELEKNNNSVVSALEEIKNILQGDEVISSVSINKLNGLTVDSSGKVVVDSTRFIYYFPYDSSLKYNISVVNNNTGGFGFTVYGTNTIPTSGSSATTLYTTVVNANSSYSYQLNSGYNYKYIILRGLQNTIYTIESVEGSVGFDGVQDSINQGNQLQQEQNQLQQEQNDILTDDNVNTDGLEFATDDTANPTSDGFNTLFTSIYNAFCNTSSAPLTVTLPYVNETFTIQPNLVSNAMQKCGLGFVATLIQSFYYYGVCLFIYKDINKIIEHLKSGNLTADCGNVKTEVL